MLRYFSPAAGALISLLLTPAAFAAPSADANNNGEITQTEYLNFRSTGFGKTDKNFDGKLTKAELSLQLQEDIDEGQRQVFHQLDKDKDGRLTLEDFSKPYDGTTSESVELINEAQDKNFDRYDTDGNGNISRSEYRDFGNTQMKQAMDQFKIYAEKSFNALDLNHDGYADEDEYVYKGRDPNAALSVNTANPFSDRGNAASSQKQSVRRDGNGDGIITKTEDTAFNRYQFETMDKDSDGIITKNESLYLFMDSSALTADDDMPFEFMVLGGSEVRDEDD